MQLTLSHRCAFGAVLGVLFVIHAGRAQDAFAPLGALPMQFNPSFAGEAAAPRVSINTVFATPTRITGWGHLTHVSYDQFVPKLRSGIGISVNHSVYNDKDDATARNQINRPYSSSGYGVSFAVAPKFSMRGKYTFSPSIDLTYDGSRSTYENWINTNEAFKTSGGNLTARVGVLFNTQKWYAGHTLYLPIGSSVRRSIGDSLLPNHRRPLVSYWQFGYTFQRSSESKFSFTPQLLFQTGDDATGLYIKRLPFSYFRLVDVMLNFRYKKFIWGLNGAGIHVGYQSPQMRIMVTQTLRSTFGYLGNVSFRYVFKQNGETGRQRW